jgi:uncharacterized protein (DUF1778 family)
MSKPLTRSFRQLVRKRAAHDAEFRTALLVSPAAYRQFLARLDAPPKPNDRLRRTMRTVPPWA